MSQEIIARLDGMQTQLDELQKQIVALLSAVQNENSWVTVNDFHKQFPQWSKSYLYQEFKIAIALASCDQDCDLIPGTHFQNTSKGVKPHYKVNAPLLAEVLKQLESKRVPTRPLSGTLVRTLENLQVLSS